MIRGATQAVVSIVGDESGAVSSLKKFNAAVEASERQAQRDFGAIEKHAKRVALGFAAVGAAAGALIFKSVQAAAEGEAVWKSLDKQLDNAGVSFQEVQRDITAMARELQLATRFGDEETARVLQTLVRFNGDYAQSLRLVELVYDVAIGTQRDYTSAAELVGKATAGNTRSMRELGIGATSGADAVRQLQERFGGLAREDGATLEAQLLRVKNAVDDLFQAIGKAVVGPEAAEGIDGIAAAILRLADAIEERAPTFNAWFERMGKLKDAALGLPGYTGVIPDPLGIGGIVNPGRAPRLLTGDQLQEEQLYDFIWANRSTLLPPRTKSDTSRPSGGGFSTPPGANLPKPGTPSVSGVTTLTVESVQAMVDKQWKSVADIFGTSAKKAIAGIEPLDIPAWSGPRAQDWLPEGVRPGLATDPADQEARNRQLLGFAGVVANAGVGVAQGGNPLGGLGSIAGAASGLFTGGASTALGVASLGLGVLSSIFGNSREREEEAYRAHLRALRESREPTTIVNLRFPDGVIDPRNPDWKLAVADVIREIGGTGTGGIVVNTVDD